MAAARSATGPDLLVKETHAMELLVKVVILKASTICRANDLCKGGNIQTVNAEDVYKVPNEIEFSKFLEPLIKDCIGRSKNAACSKMEETGQSGSVAGAKLCSR